MRSLRIGLVFACLGLSLLTVGGCRKRTVGAEVSSVTSATTSEKSSEPAATLSILMPLELLAPVHEISQVFQAGHPSLKLRLRAIDDLGFDKSDFEKEKPDVVISQGDREIQVLEREKLIKGESKRWFATGAVAVLVPFSNPSKITGLLDLTKASSIALPKPDLGSAGYYAQQMLQRSGFWEKVQKKVIYTESGKRPKDLVARGRAAAALVLKPCVDKRFPQTSRLLSGTKIVALFPLEAGLPVPCAAAVSAETQQAELAGEFLSFLMEDKAQAVCEKWGLKRARMRL